MSHEISTRANGFAEMAFVGETPWHKLGQQLTEGASIEEWTVAAGMDWRVQRSKVRYHFGHEAHEFATWDDNQVLFRSDNHAPLGLVSPGYKVVQPRQVLEFFRDLTADNGMQLHTAGVLFGGRKFWALAKMADSYVGCPTDRVGGFLLLSTSCDGSQATEARFTTVRVVCNNTLTAARADGSKGSIKVSHRSKFCDQKMKRELGMGVESFGLFMDKARELAAKRMSRAGAEEFVRLLLRPDEKPAERVALRTEGDDFAALLSRTVGSASIANPEPRVQRAPKGEADILRLFNGAARGSGLDGTVNTAWQMVNAVSEHVDHERFAKSTDHRLDSAWFGNGDELKSRAFELALQF